MDDSNTTNLQDLAKLADNVDILELAEKLDRWETRVGINTKIIWLSSSTLTNTNIQTQRSTNRVEWFSWFDGQYTEVC